ncbi:general secretion pathway protein GspK [Pseudomonas syringae]|uniref:general secretion pathway protein GspK n=1 Tax=Pseudomonas syringae TaxID=317 RepID=UPI001F3114BA|nr:general secretion pathway protein GspK [Pseudomonas syringae]MCF5720134.1 general secretion pathway protein GspK [Pseudomonas syringae]
MKRYQRGVALLSVLLVMSLALLLTAGMLRSHQLLVQSSARQVHQVQLVQLALSAQEWASIVLQSLDDEQQRVHLAQPWAHIRWPFAIDGAQISLHIEDLSGRFNINTLLGAGPVDPLARQRWTRLLGSLGLDAVDLPATGNVRELSQLRGLAGIDAEFLRTLEPWVAALPREATLNINTAPAQVLAMLEGVSMATAEALVNQRPEDGYASVQAFTHGPLVAGAGLNSQGLGVGSRWFRVYVDVSLGNSRLRLASEVERERKTGRWRVVQRRLLPPTSSESFL